MMYDLDSLMGFGKYADKTVEDLLEENPRYLLWCLENVDDFEVDGSLHDAIVRAAGSFRG